MIVLAVLLAICIYVFIERAIAIGRADRTDERFMSKIKDYIHDGELQSADNLCKSTDTPYSRLVQKGISRIGRPMNDVLVTIENTGNLEVANLSRGFTWLATIAAAALSEIFARLYKTPATVFLIIGIIPLVPGGGIYYAMEHAINGETDLFLDVLFHTLGLAGSLAVGVLLVSSTVRLINSYVYRRRKMKGA